MLAVELWRMVGCLGEQTLVPLVSQLFLPTINFRLFPDLTNANVNVDNY